MCSRGKLMLQLALQGKTQQNVNENQQFFNSQVNEPPNNSLENVWKNPELFSESSSSILETALSNEFILLDNNLTSEKNDVAGIDANSNQLFLHNNLDIESKADDENRELSNFTDDVNVNLHNDVEYNLITMAELQGNNQPINAEIEERNDPSWNPDKDNFDSDSNNSAISEQSNRNGESNGNDNNNIAKKCRKRMRNEGEWVRNSRKTKRNCGLEYINSRKNKTCERKMLPPCKETCMFRCSEKIDEESRRQIFTIYWNLSCLQRQRHYILKCISAIPHTKNNSLRKENYAFYFELDSKKIRTCKVFFIHTLGISDRTVRTVIAKTKDGFLENEKRGKHGNQKKVDESIKQDIIEHINSIPRVESHYLRAQTTREFIDGSKTLADIHRDYVEERNRTGKGFGNYTMYSRIFNSKFNISFFSPKKDLCGLCEQFKNSNEKQKEELQESYDRHLKEKELSRSDKGKDKELAKAGELIAACFDLQAVLSTPSGDVNTFYYKSKLATYNLTVYDLGLSMGHCFVWNENDGKRGCNEIATCIFRFLMSVQSGKPVIFYADNCTGQNKNKFLVAMLLYAVRTLDIPSIILKFLVVGHTQNEGDAMHSLIEKQKKRVLKGGSISTPAQWIPVIANAKKTGTPFKINELDYHQFFDFKAMQEALGSNFNKNSEEEKVLWHDIAIIKVIKGNTSTFFYKNSYEDENFKEVCIRKHAERLSAVSDNMELKILYSEPLKISQLKLDGFSELCEKNHIKEKYHEFYKSLGCKIQTKSKNKTKVNILTNKKKTKGKKKATKKK